MTKDEKYSLARWAMQHALDNGAQHAKVLISDRRSSSVEIRDEKIDKLEQSIQNSLSISLYVDNKYSAHSTNRLKQEELGRFIEQAIEGTRYLSEDEFRTLPDPSLYYKGEGKDLKMADDKFDDILPETKIQLARDVEKEVLGKDERIISVTSSYYDGLSGRVMVTSNGFSGDTENTYFGLYATVSIKSDDSRPESYWSESAVLHEDLKTKGIGELALEKAIQKVGQDKVESAKLPMIVENRQLGRILSPLISALNGSAIQQKNSFLIDKLDTKVVSDKLSITDDPFIPSGRGSQLFDNEGLAAKKRAVFEKGTLKTYFIDTYYARKMDVQPTTGGTSNLVFETGDKTLEEVIASTKKGILVLGFNGGNCNGSTGNFSYGIEGFLIEDGKRTKPVSGMNITGNMIDLWGNILEVGKDVYENSSWRTPSIKFDAVDFSGA